MKSVFVLCSVLAVSDASECQADENSLLQSRKLVRTTKMIGSDNSHVALEKLQEVANSLLEGSDTTMTTDEVNDALDAASQALAELEPAIRQQVVTAQQQITDATAAVQACHTGEQAELRTSLQRSMGQRAAAVESCHNALNELQAAETQQCGIAEDCLCDEARVRTTDQEALCAAMTETYEVAFCEHHHVCTLLHQCHSDEAEVYRALRADVEAEMEVITQEYIAVEQSRCLTGLIMEAMTPPVTPISHAALVACNDVDTSGLHINFPDLPAEPAACPAHAHGDPQCGGGIRWVWTNGHEACDPACGRESMTCDQSAFPVGLEATQVVYNAMGLNCNLMHLENQPFDPCFGHHPTNSAGRCNYVDREQLTTCSAACGWRRICPCRSSD